MYLIIFKLLSQDKGKKINEIQYNHICVFGNIQVRGVEERCILT